MEKNNVKTENYQYVDVNADDNIEQKDFSKSKKCKTIKGINGDFTIVDEYGGIVEIGLGL
ncbi:MAG: hypothetical protein HDR50_11985 [Desulfovibrio sp.]|uniref:hypothetical protein n=1 Tax=Desulfovibrio sp. TaxID=885 RepID=UPI001A723829|nr:hypothetical protein [Desulfovibrio sp.]MBD5418331.1 hypothetical protein [Desulfovibrio sp.]